MTRAAVLSILVVVVLLVLGVTAEAQQPTKISRIGYLSARDSASESTRAEAIRLALRELGYIEGQNIAFEYRYAEGKRERFPELAAELVRLKVDLIVAAGGAIPTRAAMNATKTIPIVMVGARTDPVKAGYEHGECGEPKDPKCSRLLCPAREMCLFLYSPRISLKTPFETNFPPFFLGDCICFEFAAE